MRTIKRVIVGAFIFSTDGKVLLGKTGDGGVYKDSWVVPGGGVESGETMLDAVLREVNEEVGLLIDPASAKQLSGAHSGESQKTLKNSNETVLVKMTFHDFVIQLETTAEDTILSLDDDLAEAKWFSKDELRSVQLGGATSTRLKKLNYL